MYNLVIHLSNKRVFSLAWLANFKLITLEDRYNLHVYNNIAIFYARVFFVSKF